MPSTQSSVGWTKAEYDACPELANRLHQRILDLTDERDRYRAALYEVMDTLGAPDKRTSAHKALEIAKQAVYGTGSR